MSVRFEPCRVEHGRNQKREEKSAVYLRAGCARWVGTLCADSGEFCIQRKLFYIFLRASQVDQDILDNLEWQAKKPDEEIRTGRENMIERLEWAGAQQRSSGSLERWWLGVDPEIRQVAGKCIV